MKDIGLGIVGTGRMAARMMQALTTVPHFEVRGVASGLRERGNAFAAAFDIPTVSASARDLAERPEIDAIYICSRSGRHVSDAMAAMDAGKPVLVEKPLATTLSDAQRLVETARDRRCLLVENLWCLALPSYRRIGEGLKSGSYGKPVQLQFSFGYPVLPAGHPSLFDPADGGALLDRGVYGVSLALHLLGPVETVQATAQRDENGVDLTSDLLLQHVSGASSQVSVSLNSLMANRASLSCTHGAMELGAPVVGSESFVGRQVTPLAGEPSTNAVQPIETGLKSRLKSNPFLRRFKRLADTTSGRFLSHGPDQYMPMLTHFHDLISSNQSESSLVSLDLSLATQDVLEQARGLSRKG